MTVFGWVGEKGTRVATLPSKMRGFFAQNDDVKRTTATAKAKARAGAKTKYRDLSTAAAKCAAFGRDDVCCGAEKEQATARAKATAGSFGFARGSRGAT